MSAVEVGITKSGAVVSLPLSKANRHGLVTGSTGTGKSTTLQRLAEEFSRAGVPVFAADIKGDLSGIAARGDDASPLADKTRALGRTFTANRSPVAFWDLFGVHGLPIRTSLQEMGAELIARMLGLNETQAGAVAIALKKSDDERGWLLTLDDLRWELSDMMERREEICSRYGNVTAASIAAIQRNILALESQGGDRLFGEPRFDILDFIQLDDVGRGVVNLLHADQLMECPRLYATFLLWLLTELFRVLPEVGDLDKPKLVFFFDEAHLLFAEAPKAVVAQVERLVRLVRSKGVGVFFVTQSPADVPETVLAQLGNRIAHSLRAFTPAGMKLVRATAAAFRENRGVDVRGELTALGVGEAFVSVLDDAGIPTRVERVSIIPPSGQVGPISDMERRAIIEGVQNMDTLRQRYGAELPEAEAIHSFYNRMRRQRGIPEEAFKGGWTQGGYRQFMPHPSAAWPAARSASWRGLAAWSAVAACCVLVIRAALV
jgi:DNA helicase HerA-like ATPase